MGMAASQARFLQLTARRTNIEYQGQQINQQRLALANASAGLFEKMLTLAVPTPPSSQDDKYYTQGYNFTDPADGIQKKIYWSSTELVVGDFEGTEFVNTSAVTSGHGVSIASNGSTICISSTTLAAAAGGDATAMNDLLAAIGTPTTSEQEALGYTNVIRNVTVEHNIYDPDGNFTTVQNQSPAVLQFDNLNRLLTVTLLNDPHIDIDAETASDGRTSFITAGDKLTYASVFDDVAYMNDVNRYEFEKAAYDYQIERINQETKQVQVQDKSLELKMKQLDTEHNAVQTEMEAVQKVIQKNIESSFKTFA